MKKRILKGILASVMAVSALVSAVLAAPAPETPFGKQPTPFEDISPSAWYYEYVESAYESGLIDGTGPNTFDPDRTMLYSETVKLAACMHQRNAEGAVSLTNGDPWYQPYVEYAEENGIISKDYDWDAIATRADYAEIFANALPEDKYGEYNYVPDGDIPDISMDHPQADAIYKLYRAGILEGVDDTHAFKPDTTISRAEVVTVVSRMMDIDMRVLFSPVTDDVDDPSQMLEDEGIRLEDFIGVWHTTFAGGATCELEILSVNEDGVLFDIWWERIGGYENVQTYYNVNLRDEYFTPDQVFLYYTTDDGAGGTLIFEQGKITLSITQSLDSYADGTHVFETRGNRMFDGRLFDESEWALSMGTTNATQFGLVFHADGTFDAYHFDEKTSTGNYRYDGESIYMPRLLDADGNLGEEIAYTWDGESFVSEEVFYDDMTMEYIHYYLSPTATE